MGPSLRTLRTSFFALSLLALSGAARGDGASAVTWRTSTHSPQAAALMDARRAALVAVCGTPDAALNDAADRAARKQAGGAPMVAIDELAFYLRAAGDPHVWPRAWSIAGASLNDDDVKKRLKTWLSPWGPLGVRRCGASVVTGPTDVVTVVAADVLADIDPLPTTARVGQWVSLSGSMLVPASDAKVVLLGPRGAPKTIVASLSGSRIRSSFSVDQPGTWMVQVLATVSTGPRPVLEAMIHAGITPPAQFVSAPAPGEDAAKGIKDDDDAMARMINAARAAEQLAALTRDPALDKLAKAHTDEMMKARVVGHDVGLGDPSARIRAAGLRVRVAGENVASATTLENAHRALWASPSHRGNLLFERFTKVGVSVQRSADGVVWVTEMFSG